MNKPSRHRRAPRPKGTRTHAAPSPATTSELLITRMGQRGEGVAQLGEKSVFVPYSLPGETVRAEVVDTRGTLLQLCAPSAERVAPICPHFGTCGGCQVQHWQPHAYRAWKRELVVDALLRHGLEVPVANLVDAHGVGRRRATLHTNGQEAGYRAWRSHDLVPLDECPILAPSLRLAPRIAAALGRIFGPASISFTEARGGLDIAVVPDGPPADAGVKTELLAGIARQYGILRITRGTEIILQLGAVELDIGPASVALPPRSFLQATQAAEALLADQVQRFVGKAKRVADLFCGLGPFALRLAQTAQVFAADSDRAAVKALDAALKATPGLKYLGTEVRDLFADPLIASELARYDAVVFDPPRAGARAQAEELARARVKKIVAVSCDPASFARDAAILVNGGYRLDEVVPMDQFRHAAHVELVAKFTRARL